MAVETYLIDELTELIHDQERNGEWKAKIEELGLEGQKSLLIAPEKSPVPFPLMNTVMTRVYETLCPAQEDVEQYAGNTIPLRALSLIALCKQEGYFKKIMVWSDNTKPDPIAVGYLNDKWDSPRYIIARWGDELRSFPELVQLATKRKIESAAAKLKKEIAQRTEAVKNIENEVELFFQGEWSQFIN